MRDQVITPELASGLSRIEFNEPTAFYYNNGELTYSSTMPTNYQLDGGPFASKTQTAPVWCQAFDWFRKRGYGILVDNMDEENGDWSYRIEYGYVHEEVGLFTMQEARIKCLTKLIEIHELRRA